MTDSFDHGTKKRVWLPSAGDWLKCVGVSPLTADVQGLWFRVTDVRRTPIGAAYAMKSPDQRERLVMPRLFVGSWEPDESGDEEIGEPAAGPSAG